MWRFGDLPRQILAGEVQLLVQAGAPLRAIGDIVNHAGMRHIAARASLSGVSLELAAEDRSVLDVGLRVGPPHGRLSFCHGPSPVKNR